MDFRFTEQEEAFREEVRTLLKRELPQPWYGFDNEEGDDREWAFGREFTKKLADRGWLTLAWPKEYGGQGRSHMEQLIYNEEMAYNRAPGGGGHGVAWVGPALMLYGTEEQKRFYLPKISSGEIVFCTLYSEPGAGSDLASLQTKVVDVGDSWVINGQKIFNSGAHRSDYAWLAARTDPDAPKHRGISTFIFDMKTPGVTVRPLYNMANAHYFNEVFLDDVRVPKDTLVGQLNRGWYQVAVALDFERSGIGRAASARRTLEELTVYAKEAKRNGRFLAEDPTIRRQLGELTTQVERCRLLSYRIAWMQSQGMVPNYETSMAKVFGSELGQRLVSFGMQLLGLYGQLPEGNKWAPLRGRIERSYMTSVSATIAAGTSEINRNVIATRGLGLPR